MAAKTIRPVKDTDSPSLMGWLEKPLNLFGVVFAFATAVFGGGYAIGIYKADLERQVATIKQEQDCNERVEQEKDKCAEYRRSVETEKMEELNKTIESLKNTIKK